MEGNLNPDEPSYKGNKTMVRYNEPVIVAEHPKPDVKPITLDDLLGNASMISTQTILNSIFPPICWTEGGMLWMQTISDEPGTDEEVIALQDQLDYHLEKENAKETEFCEIRRKYYAECFDEIIRQVIIKNPERGLLLLSCRDEYNLTFNAYETFFCSSVVHGERKSNAVKEEKGVMYDLLNAIETKTVEMDATIIELQDGIVKLKNDSKEARKNTSHKYGREIDYLERTNKQMQNFLDNILKKAKKP